MELRQLKYFIAIAEELHFGRAAEKLNVTPSALSQQIHLLEDELKVDLFDQHKRLNFRRVELTEAGSVFLEEAKKTVKYSEIAIEKTRNTHKKERIIRFGIFRNVLPQRVERIMELWTTHFPHIKIEMIECESASLVQQTIYADAADIGLGLLPLKHETLDSVMYDETHFGILMNKNHILADKRAIKLKLLRNEKWIDYGKGVNTYNNTIEKICEKAGFSRQNNIAQVVPSIELLKRWVDLGKGLAFMPLALDISKDPNLVLKHIINDDGTPFIDMPIRNILVYKKENSNELIKKMVQLVEKAY